MDTFIDVRLIIVFLIPSNTHILKPFYPMKKRVVDAVALARTLHTLSTRFALLLMAGCTERCDNMYLWHKKPVLRAPALTLALAQFPL